MLIKTHKDLAALVRGKSILHLNSLGKDSAVCLEWLVNYAKPRKVVAAHFARLCCTPWDKCYLDYQRKRYGNVQFISVHNGHELSDFPRGVYQFPLDVIHHYNHWEYVEFALSDYAIELKEHYGCDYICSGFGKYESVSRAINFHRRGLVHGDTIYPIGLMSKKDILNVISQSEIKLHRAYFFSESTFDYPSYYKMRSAFLARPDYYERMLQYYPLLALDKYRYEVMLK